MSRYYIVTRNRDAYVIQEDGTIDAYNSYHPSPDWKITGMAEMRPFGSIRRHGLDTLKTLADQGSLAFKNGACRYTLTDVDHGTHRMHGNVAYHGIAYIETLQA